MVNLGITTTCITVDPKTMTAAVAKRGEVTDPTAEKEAGNIILRARWMKAKEGESQARRSIVIITLTDSPGEGMGQLPMEGGGKEDPGTKKGVHPTEMEKEVLEEKMVPMEKRGDIGPMDLGDIPLLREMSPMTEKRHTVTSKNI